MWRLSSRVAVVLVARYCWLGVHDSVHHFFSLCALQQYKYESSFQLSYENHFYITRNESFDPLRSGFAVRLCLTAHSITFFIVNRPGVLGVLRVLGVWGAEGGAPEIPQFSKTFGGCGISGL